MPDPPPTPAEPSAVRSGLRLADLVGLIVGYSLASLLARTVWPGYAQVAGGPLVAFALEFGWLGLAMSGPVLLVLGRLGSGSGPRGRQPAATRRAIRPGRPIGEVMAGDRWADPKPPSPGPPFAELSEWTRAELAWLGIGSYWITVTLFIAGARARGMPGPLANLIPVLAIIGLIVLCPMGLKRRVSPPARGWTHGTALGLLWTWPIAWGLLVLLGQAL